MTAVAPTSSPARRRLPGRVLGIDAARALAVVGMVAVHVGPSPRAAATLTERLYAVPHGRASILFVVLAGLGVSLLDRSSLARQPHTGRRRTLLRLAWRAVVLLPLGLVLQPLDHGVLVILQYYALYFLVAAAAVRLGDRALVGGAVLLATLGPVLRLAAQRARPDWFTGAPAGLGDPLPDIARDLLLTGSYPAITWSAPLLFGMWLGRRELGAPGAPRRLVAGGVAAAALAGGAGWLLEVRVGPPGPAPSWSGLVTARAHSEMPLWLVAATGVAVAVLGLCLLLGRRWPRVVWPLAAVGQLALTVYVGHVLVLVAVPTWLARDDVAAATISVLRFTVVVAAAAVAWRRVARRGPLEALLRLPADATWQLASRALHARTRHGP